MPISITDYKNEPESAISKILSILEQQPYQAYTLNDLIPGLNRDQSIAFVELLTFQTTLTALIKQGRAKSKYINGTTYYVSSKAV
jgi:hypothetical protein